MRRGEKRVEREARRGVPELGLISAELHVGPEGAEVQSGLSYSQWGLFVVDGLLQSHNVPLLVPDLLQNLLAVTQ